MFLNVHTVHNTILNFEVDTVLLMRCFQHTNDEMRPNY